MSDEQKADRKKATKELVELGCYVNKIGDVLYVVYPYDTESKPPINSKAETEAVLVKHNLKDKIDYILTPQGAIPTTKVPLAPDNLKDVPPASFQLDMPRTPARSNITGDMGGDNE